MSQAPPPYPGNEKGGAPPNPAYPQQPGGNPYPQQQYGMQPAPPPDYPQTMASAPPQGQYQPPPPQQGYPPQGYPAPPQQGYPQQGYPQQGYPQQPMQPQVGPTVVVTTQPTVAVVQRFRESPVHVQCPYCHADIITATSYETGTLAWLICALMCIFGLDAGCCLIPFCCDACKDVSHSCPNCRQVIQRWNRM